MLPTSRASQRRESAQVPTGRHRPGVAALSVMLGDLLQGIGDLLGESFLEMAFYLIGRIVIPGVSLVTGAACLLSRPWRNKIGVGRA